MYKLIYLKSEKNINIHQLYEELSEICESYDFKQTEEEVILMFKNVFPIYDSENIEEIISFKKEQKSYNENGELVTKLIDCDFKMVLKTIKSIILNHSPKDNKNIRYDQLIEKLVGEKYSTGHEISLIKKAYQALKDGVPEPDEYVDYYKYVEDCKNKAHIEIYGTERVI